MQNFISFIGIIVFCIIAWLLSSSPKKVNWRPVLIGLALQFVFAAMVFLAPGSKSVFVHLSIFINTVIEASREGLTFVFGKLGTEKCSLGTILAFQVLPFIIVFSAFMAILYYLKIIPFIIRGLAKFIFTFMGTSGAESLCAASNIFVGIESVTAIRPYIRKMTRSELFLILTVGMATVASSVMALYVSFLNNVFPSIAGHLLSASILSVPAAIVVCKLMEPETAVPETGDWEQCKMHHDAKASCMTEAVIGGANNGAKLAVGVAVTLIAFVGILGVVRVVFAYITGGSMGVEQLLGYIFYPFTWLMGVKSSDVPAVSELLGIRIILTEIPAYIKLGQLAKNADPRTVLIASYSLCGFAHIASVAIFTGGIGALAPERMPLLAKLGFKALIAATLTTLMTGAIAGVFFCGSGILTQ